MWRTGKGHVALTAAANANADALGATVEDIRSQGTVSLRAIAAALNEREMMIRRGGQWRVSFI